MTKQHINTSATALKALRVLETVAASSQLVSVSEISDSMSVDKATVYRMLITLTKAGYIVRDENSRKYKLGYKIVSLSRNLLAENEISRLVQQTLEQISIETQATLHYSLLDGDETVLVQRVKGSQLVTVDFQIGDRSSLHCTAIGKVLLAFQDHRFIQKIIDAGLPKLACNTITHPDEFRKELQRIRSEGYAIDNRELSDNMRCIAVPIFEGGGRIKSGISISGPDSRFTLEKLSELKVPMMQASRRLSEQLGGVPWTE